jgi:hypothetical protein
MCRMLRTQQVNLQFEVVALVSLQACPVLAHQNEQRQENRFQGHDQGHEREGIRVEGMLPCGLAERLLCEVRGGKKTKEMAEVSLHAAGRARAARRKVANAGLTASHRPGC